MAATDTVRAGQAHGRSRSTSSARRYRLGVALFLFAALFVAGGASRAEEPRQIVAQLACIVALAATAWRLEMPASRLPSLWRRIGLGAYFLLIAQLIPLPPSLWAILPGHRVYSDIAAATGTVGWRPLTLTPDTTLSALFALLAPTAAIVVGLFLDTKARVTLWACLIGAALASAGLGLLQLAAPSAPLRLYRETSFDSAVGMLANRNHQAVFLACALPPLGALLGNRMHQRPALKLLALGMAAVLFLAIGDLATSSRAGALLGLGGAACGLWAFRAAGARLHGIRGHKVLLGLALTFATLILLAIAISHHGVVSRFGQSDPASETRVQMVAPLLHTAGAFFPFGSGFGSFATVYRQFEPNALLSTIYMNQAHNEPLQLAIEGGLPALTLLAIFLWWWFTTATGILRAALPAQRRAFAIASVSVSALLMLQSLVDYPLRTPLLAALFAFACFEMARTAAYRPASRA